jgi:uncharacterized protein (TIGR03067 family)
MRTKWIAAAAVFGLGLALTGCKSKEQKEAEKAAQKAELEKLKGKWQVASREGDDDGEEGEKTDPSDYYVIDGDMMKYVFKDRDGKEHVIYRQKINIITDKDPKQIDLTLSDENGNPLKVETGKKGVFTGRKKTAKAKTVGIYKIDGDKLTMCLSWDEKKRPTGFTAKRGTGQYLMTLDRIKEGHEPVSASAPEDKTPKVKEPEPKAKAVEDKAKEDAGKAKEPKAKEDAGKPKAPAEDL